MKTFQRDLSGYDTIFGHARSPYTCADNDRLYVEHHQIQTGSRNCTQNRKSNNLATETDIDAISVAVPMFWGKVFTGVYVHFARHFLPSEIPRWRTYTESSYNIAKENDTKVISEGMFQGTPDPPPPASTLSD